MLVRLKPMRRPSFITCTWYSRVMSWCIPFLLHTAEVSGRLVSLGNLCGPFSMSIMSLLYQNRKLLYIRKQLLVVTAVLRAVRRNILTMKGRHLWNRPILTRSIGRLNIHLKSSGSRASVRWSHEWWLLKCSCRRWYFGGWGAFTIYIRLSKG